MLSVLMILIVDGSCCLIIAYEKLIVRLKDWIIISVCVVAVTAIGNKFFMIIVIVRIKNI
jgi:hypothetical protein